jgi:GH43 family beta-xylosidase
MMSAAGGASPWDPYTYAGQITPNWGIDATILRFNTGNYLVWSCFINNGPQSLCIATLNSPTSIGTPRLLSKPTNSWETVRNPVNEGPAAIYHGGKTMLAFSASDCWSSSYQLGLLTWNGSGDPLNSASWTKTGPVFSSANGNYGTGHNG